MLAVLICLVFGLAYVLNKYLLSYWSRLGFQQINPGFLVGDAGEVLRMKTTMASFFQNVYNNNKNKRIVGAYVSYKPILVVTDTELVQKMLISDFTSFHDRPMPVDEEKDPLSAHLFNLPGQKWRDLRVKLSPTFTSGKLKGMFPIINDCGQVLEDYLFKNLKNGVDTFEFRDLMARYTTNIISSVAFGIDNDCINEPDHVFRKMGAKFFETNLINGIKFVIFFLGGPHLLHKTPLKSVSQDVEDFIFSIVNQTVEHREKNNFSRKDFMQLMIQLKNQGFVHADKEDSTEAKKDLQKLTINQIAAQVFVFFIAGFETSSSTISFCLFELARRPDIQKKVHDEIDKLLASAGPEGFTYDNLSELKYLECCIDETLRKYPIVPVLNRTASRNYPVPGSKLSIPKDEGVYIPVLGFHRDPEIYENPMEFKPERFLKSSTGTDFSKGTFYLPFGDGPRNCIGARMGKFTTKVGLVKVLSKFHLELSDKEMNHQEIEFSPFQFILTPTKPFGIKITPRTK